MGVTAKEGTPSSPVPKLSGFNSVRDARDPAARQQPHPLTRFERFVRFLGDGAQFATVQFDRDLKAILAGGPLLEHAAGIQADTDARTVRMAEKMAGMDEFALMLRSMSAADALIAIDESELN